MKRVPQTHQFISRKERKKSKWQKSKCAQLVSTKYMKIRKVLQTKIIINMKRAPESQRRINLSLAKREKRASGTRASVHSW